MRIALLSDVHGNLPAFEAVLGAPSTSAGRGDLVPRRPRGLRRRAGRLRRAGARALRRLPRRQPRPGRDRRHRHRATSPAAPPSPPRWTRETIGEEALEFLRGPRARADTGASSASTTRSPRDPVWEYVLSTLPGRRSACDLCEPRVGAVGHSHVALLFHREHDGEVDGAQAPRRRHELRSDAGRVADQPRRRRPAARRRPTRGVAPARHRGWTATWRRVEYPIDEAAEAIEEAGLPDVLADAALQRTVTDASAHNRDLLAVAASPCWPRLRLRRAEGEPIPRAPPAELQTQLDERSSGASTLGGGACDDIPGRRPATPRSQASDRLAARDVDADVRDALQESFDRLFAARSRAVRAAADRRRSRDRTEPPTEDDRPHRPRPRRHRDRDRGDRPRGDHPRRSRRPATAADAAGTGRGSGGSGGRTPSHGRRRRRGRPGGRGTEAADRDRRPLPDRAPPRRRRHVDRLPGDRHRARAPRGGQAARRAPGRRRGLRRPLPPRGAGRGAPAAPEHRAGVRLRAGRREPTATTSSWSTWTAPRAPTSCASTSSSSVDETVRDRPRRLPRPRLRPPRRRRAPRREAGQPARRRGDGTTKLADFGIAKAAEQTRITQVGSVLGTAAYLSPEQARGEEAGPASDIYSLGVCAYQFLTGPAAARVRVAHRAGAEAAAGPGRADHRYRPEVPPELDEAIRALPRARAGGRYASALEIGQALEAGLHGEHRATRALALSDTGRRPARWSATAATRALPHGLRGAARREPPPAAAPPRRRGRAAPSASRRRTAAAAAGPPSWPCSRSSRRSPRWGSRSCRRATTAAARPVDQPRRGASRSSELRDFIAATHAGAQ